MGATGPPPPLGLGEVLRTLSGNKPCKDYDAMSPICNSKPCFTAKHMDGSPTEFWFSPNWAHWYVYQYQILSKNIFALIFSVHFLPRFWTFLLCWFLSTFLVCIIDNFTQEVLATEPLIPCHVPACYINILHSLVQIATPPQRPPDPPSPSFRITFVLFTKACPPLTCRFFESWTISSLFVTAPQNSAWLKTE